MCFISDKLVPPRLSVEIGTVDVQKVMERWATGAARADVLD